jgi:hypothetical protein
MPMRLFASVVFAMQRRLFRRFCAAKATVGQSLNRAERSSPGECAAFVHVCERRFTKAAMAA